MNRLAEIMKKENVTPVQLSKMTGLSDVNIRRIMKNPTAVPYHKTAMKLSKALGYTVAQIMGEKDL